MDYGRHGPCRWRLEALTSVTNAALLSFAQES